MSDPPNRETPSFGKQAEKEATRDTHRKYSLKDPKHLWFVTWIVTFILTIFPAVLIEAFSMDNPETGFTLIYFGQIVMNNLYPMIITQSAVTALQNFSIASPSDQAHENMMQTPRFGWTVVLIIAVVVYSLAYPITVLIRPKLLNLVMLGGAGLLAGCGLGATLQIDHELANIRAEYVHEDLFRWSYINRQPPPFVTPVGSESETNVPTPV